MKKFLMAAAAVAAFVAPAANAAVYTSSDAGGIVLTEDDLSDAYAADTSGSGFFTDTFQIFIPISGLASANASFSSTPASALAGDFTGGLYNSANELISSFSFINFGGSLVGALNPVTVTGGQNYTLVFSGTANAATSYGGNFTVAVPEPATWAMMVAGIGAVGLVMRRRSQSARVAFS